MFLSFDEFLNEIAKSTLKKREGMQKKRQDMSDEDPDSYEPLPGDTKGRKNLKTSKWTNLYRKHFNESDAKDLKDGEKRIDSEKIEKALKKKEEETGIPIEALRVIMRRGMAAWRSSHRPGAGQEQWGYARINSFATGGETRQSTDKDIWMELPKDVQNKLPGKKPN